MSSITTPISFTANTLIRSADVNTNFTNINTVVNGNIDNTNIVAGAAIARSKLASGTAYVILANNSSGVMSENAALTASKVVLSDTNGQLTTGTPSVSQGGTGATTLTNHGVLLGQATSAITATSAGTQYQVLVSGGASADPAFAAISLGQAAAVSGQLPIGNGGTGASTAAGAMSAISPITTTGDMIYSSSGTTNSRLAIGSSGQYLRVSGGIPAWQSSAAAALAVTTKTASYTITSSDDIILGNTNAITLTLPAASSNSGKVFYIKKIGSDANAVTIARAGSDTIDGQTTRVLSQQYDEVALVSDGSALWADLNQTGSYIAPTVQVLTSGTGATYTLPTSPRKPKYLKIKMSGPGGGGGGSGAGGGTGSNGSANTTFGSSLLTANLGSGGAYNGAGGTGGSYTVSGPAIGFGSIGGAGQGAAYGGGGNDGPNGGMGGANGFGGAGAGGQYNVAGKTATANTGGGGGGAGQYTGAASASGSGGGAGGYIEAIIPNPSATYTYTIGTGGGGGTAGTSGFAGGAGADGIIVVEEHYQ